MPGPYTSFTMGSGNFAAGNESIVSLATVEGNVNFSANNPVIIYGAPPPTVLQTGQLFPSTTA